jgi:hypothetical protein
MHHSFFLFDKKIALHHESPALLVNKITLTKWDVLGVVLIHFCIVLAYKLARMIRHTAID